MPSERRELPYAWPMLRKQLQDHIDDVLRSLFGGQWKAPAGNAAFTPLNPNRNDKHAGSFVIWRDGDRKGAWRDFACGDHGDVFELIGYIRKLHGKMDCYWEALKILGLPGGPGANTPRTADAARLDRERAERDRAAAALKQQEDEDGKSAAVFAQWLGLAPLAGSLAEVYLREARGIDLDRLPRLPGAIRFSPRLEHFDKESGEITEWPAMVTAMTRGSKVVAIHRTYLAPDGGGKAPVAKAKMMKGPSRGAAMRLCNGARDLSPTKAAAAGVRYPLIIGEGIETVLTAAGDQPDYRAWAAGSLSLLALLDWPECASAIVLLGENDAGEQARAEFEKACAHFRAQAQGRPFKAVFPQAGNDWNDWRQGK
jgi:hypothetical protein